MTRPTTGLTGVLRRRSAKERLKLVVAIVQEEDADPVVRELVESGLPVTKIASTGGFLRSGNATLLIGVEAEKSEEVMEILGSRCGKREVPVSAGFPDRAIAGGAVVFVMNLEQLIKL